MDPKAIEHQVATILQMVGPQTEITPKSLITTVVAAIGNLIVPIVDELSKKLCAFESRMKWMEDKLVAIEQQQVLTASLEHECKTLQEENTKLGGQLRLAAQLALSNKRHSYQYNLLLHGISENRSELDGATDARNPKFRQMIVNELQKFDSSITDGDFELAHRLGPVRPAISNDGTVPPRAIVIKFYSRYLKERLLNESVRRYRVSKGKQAATVRSPEKPKQPYLTSHRVRSPFVDEHKFNPRIAEDNRTLTSVDASDGGTNFQPTRKQLGKTSKSKNKTK